MSAPSNTDDSIGGLLTDAEASSWTGLVSLPDAEWVRLGSSDYEVTQTSDIGVWLARWRIGRLRTSTGTSDVVQVDIGTSWVIAPVICNRRPRVVFSGILPDANVLLEIRYAPTDKPIEVTPDPYAYGVIS